MHKYKDTVAVIMPMYNEAAVVGSVIKTIEPYFNTIICVDDGSSDNSAEVVAASSAHLVRHPINLGAGAATQTGIDYALLNPKMKYFVTIDADGQHSVADTTNMLNKLVEGDYDIVFGSRFQGTVHKISAFKKVFLRLAAFYSSKTSSVDLTDPHIGIRAFNRKFAENLKLTMPDFTHASELVNRVAEGGYKYAECPVEVFYTDHSKAKGQPVLNSVNIVFDLLIHRMTKK